MALIRTNPEITRKELAARTGLSGDGVKYHLDVKLLKSAHSIDNQGFYSQAYFSTPGKNFFSLRS